MDLSLKQFITFIFNKRLFTLFIVASDEISYKITLLSLCSADLSTVKLQLSPVSLNPDIPKI